MTLAEIEKLAVEVAELARQEATLISEADRIAEQLSTVRSEKEQKLQRLAGGANGAARPSHTKSQAPTDDPPLLFDSKERVCRMIDAEPLRSFTANDAGDILGLKRGTVSVYLSELAKENRIARLSMGKYQSLTASGLSPFVKAVGRGGLAPDTEALPARILSLLAAENRMFTAQDIGRRFGVADERSLNAIRGALSRLSRSGKIRKAMHGEYMALREEAQST